jgi:hypothetical protein
MTQVFIANHRNAVAQAALSASSVSPSTIFERSGVSRSGNGSMSVSGAYTGADETSVDLEILNGGAATDATTPVFAGVGSGQLAVSAVAVDAPVQAWTLTLADLGFASATAKLDLGSAVLRAKVEGEAGNMISLSIAPALTVAATNSSLLAEWPVGTARQSGKQWDWGGLPLTEAGEIEEATPRLRIGNDPEIYRPYKEYIEGDWRYSLSPPVARPLPAQCRVGRITGSYQIALSDGVTGGVSETFAATTLYDLLVALSGSTLIDVSGVVAADRRPGGASRVDVPLRTSAWVTKSSGVAVMDYIPAPSAPTEVVLLKCTASSPGADLWSISGAVSQAIGQAVTGQPYSAGPVARALIPAKGAAGAVTGETNFKFTPTSRSEADILPGVCLNPVKLGIAAKSGLQVAFTYQKKPVYCACTGRSAGAISDFLLGLGGSDMGTDLDPALKARVIALYDWRRGFFEAHDVLAMGSKTTWQVKWRAKKFLLDQAGITIATLYSDEYYTVYNNLIDPPPHFTNSLGDGVSFDSEFGANQVASEIGNYDLNLTTIILGCGINFFRPDFNFSGDYAAPFSLSVDNAHAEMFTTTALGIKSSLFDTLWLDQVVTTLSVALQTIYTDATALAAWDGFFADAQAQATFLAPSGDDLARADNLSALLGRQQSQMDYVLALAGILPKASASSGGGSAVWRDHPDELYWWVDTTGAYLPAFNNKVYYSAMRDSGSASGSAGSIVNLKEFAFGLSVNCAEKLKEGDQLTFSIASVSGGGASYQVGDEIQVSVVGAAPVRLSGGITGSDTRTWSVKGSVSGALPPFPVPAGGSAAYTEAGVSLALAEGGIPFVLGDRFSFALESAGAFRWRQGAGAWSAAQPMPEPGAGAPLFSGVSALFSRGAAPSFVTGDQASFRLHQPASPEGVRRYSEGGWQWAGADSVLTLDFGAAQPVSALALAGHQLPPSATLHAELSEDALLWQTVPLDIARRVAVGFCPEVSAARYLRLTISAATGGRIGWVWAGVPLTTQRQADSVRLRRNWALTKGSGFNPASFCAGSGRGGDIAWSMLTHADAESLLTMIDYCQTRADPLIFVPSHRFPDEAALVRVSADAIELEDWMQFQANDRMERAIALKLPLAAVLA